MKIDSPLGHERTYHILMANLTGGHHWVSQFLLRKFRIPGIAAKTIHVYERYSKQPVISKPIKKVAQERGFNTLSSTDGAVVSAGLEDIFGKRESLAAPVIEKLISEDINLSDGERENLALYIGILAAANPKHRRLLQRRLERPEEIIAYAKENREQLSAGFVTDRPDLPNAGERMGKAVDNAETSVEELSQNPELYVPLTTFHLGLQKGREEIFDRKWVLMTTEEPSFFIISDHPVIALPPTDDPSEWVNEYWSLPLVLPISPYKALLLVERDSPADEVVKIDAQTVARVNKYSMVFAEEQVYSHATSEDTRRAFASTKKEDSDRFFID